MPWAQGWTARAGLVRLLGAGSLAGSADCLGLEGGDALLPGRPGVLTGRKPLGELEHDHAVSEREGGPGAGGVSPHGVKQRAAAR